MKTLMVSFVLSNLLHWSLGSPMGDLSLDLKSSKKRVSFLLPSYSPFVQHNFSVVFRFWRLLATWDFIWFKGNYHDFVNWGKATDSPAPSWRTQPFESSSLPYKALYFFHSRVSNETTTWCNEPTNGLWIHVVVPIGFIGFWSCYKTLWKPSCLSGIFKRFLTLRISLGFGNIFRLPSKE